MMAAELHADDCRCPDCEALLVADLSRIGIPEHEARAIVRGGDEDFDDFDQPPPPVYVDGDARCPKCGRPARISRGAARCKSSRCDWRTRSIH